MEAFEEYINENHPKGHNFVDTEDYLDGFYHGMEDGWEAALKEALKHEMDSGSSDPIKNWIKKELGEKINRTWCPKCNTDNFHCNGNRYILINKIQDDYIWYVCELEYYKNPNSSWVLQPTESRNKKKAMKFCESKAKLLADILSNQVDEEGYSSKWEIEKI